MQIIPQTQSRYDLKAVETFLTSLRHTVDGCTEIRILPKDRYLPINGKREYVGNTVAGYYTNYAQAARDIAPFDGRANIYATLNPCNKKLMRRAQNRLEFNAKTTAADKDIIKVLWFPFDTDPIRPTGTSASHDELQAALARRDQIIKEVFEPKGIPVIRAMSGNGGHGLIPLIGYPNTEETQAAIKRLLNWLKETYSDKVVSVDSTVANPARVWKVYGTLACKGDNIPDAPYRRAFIELPTEPIEPFDLLPIIDGIVPADSKSGRANAAQSSSSQSSDYPDLDVDAYLNAKGRKYRKKVSGSDTLYRLEVCPFNSDHKWDAQIRKESSGRVGFICPHNLCEDLDWESFTIRVGKPDKEFYTNNRITPSAAKAHLAKINEPLKLTEYLDSIVGDASWWKYEQLKLFFGRLSEQGVDGTWITEWKQKIKAKWDERKDSDQSSKSYNDDATPTNAKNSLTIDAPEQETQSAPDLVFPKSAFHGIFEIYLEAVSGVNEVCDSYHFAVVKTLVGSIIGRGAYLYTGAKVYPNFYSCLIGDTGISRKTTALSMGRSVLERIDANVIRLNGLATPEGLIAKLTVPDDDGDDDEITDEMQNRIDATCEHEGFRMMVSLSEYAGLLKKAKKSSSDGLIQVLTDAFDFPPSLDNPTRHSPLKAVNPCLSIVALSTQSWLEESLNTEDIRGGFANRFCYYMHELTPPVPRPKPVNESALGAVIQAVNDIREYYCGKHIAFDFDDEAGEFVDSWYVENRETILNERNELVRNTMQRLDSNARKLALLYAVLENPEDDHKIHLAQFKRALTVATYWKNAMQRIFGLFAKDDQTKNENTIIERLRAKGRTKRELQQGLTRQMNSKQFNEALDALIKAERVSAAGGKLNVLF